MRKNKKGFTLIEVVMVIALTGIIMLFFADAMRELTRMSQIVQKKADLESDLTLGIRQLARFLGNSKPSFNNIIHSLDDNGNEFFDYYSDVPTETWADADKTRVITMNKTSAIQELVFLLLDPKQVDPIFYDPIAAYTYPDPVLAMDASAPLNYLAFDNGSVISGKFPQLWVDGQLFLIRAPIPLRYVKVDSSVDIETAPPREMIFLGEVKGNDLQAVTLDGKIWNLNPVNNNPILNVDQFLKSLPTAGGASPMVIVEAVKLVKLNLEVTSGTGYTLMSSTYSGGTFGPKSMVAPFVKQLVFKRESVSRTIVQTTLDLEK